MLKSVRFEKFQYRDIQVYDSLKLFTLVMSSPGLFGCQISCMMRRAVGSIRSRGITFPANGTRVTLPDASSVVVHGSYIVRSPPTALNDCEKSPTRSRSVGIVRMFSRGSFVRH